MTVFWFFILLSSSCPQRSAFSISYYQHSAIHGIKETGEQSFRAFRVFCGYKVFVIVIVIVSGNLNIYVRDYGCFNYFLSHSDALYSIILVLFFVFLIIIWKSRSSSTTGESAGTWKANRKKAFRDSWDGELKLPKPGFFIFTGDRIPFFRFFLL